MNEKVNRLRKVKKDENKRWLHFSSEFRHGWNILTSQSFLVKIFGWVCVQASD